jgi:DNA modification methylase/superfamily II DNA or RNA helicase
MIITNGKTESIITLEDFSIQEYKNFLKIKSLPVYSFIKESQISVPNEFINLIDGNFKDQDIVFDKIDFNSALFDYEKFIVELAVKKKKFAIFADCGLGKTFIFLEWTRHVLPMVPGKVLIISPLNVCEQTIQEDIKFYGKSEIVNIYNIDLDKWLLSESRIGIINYDKFRIPIDLQGKVSAVICDESSIFKTENGIIKKNVIDAVRGIPYKLCCTATPAPNDREEYANHAHILDKVRSPKEFFTKYFINKDGNWVLKPHATEAFYRYLASFSIFMRDPKTYGFKDNLKDLKPLKIIIEKIPLTEEQRQYSRSRQDTQGLGLVLNIGGIVKRGKFNQVSKGFVYSEDRKPIAISSNKPKIICDFINKTVGQILIWCCYDEETEILLREIKEKTSKSATAISGKTKEKDRLSIINDFKMGNIDIMISKAKLLGFGLNFQNCSTIIFSGMLDSYEQYHQELKRVYRYGNKNAVVAYIPLTQYEEIIYANVLSKKNRFEQDAILQEKLYQESIMQGFKDFLFLKDGQKEKIKEITKIHGKGFLIMNNDNVFGLENIKEDSIAFSIFSPPFASLFTYSSEIADMGNCGDSDEEFTMGYRFFAQRLLKVMMPGRKVVIHVSQLPILKSLTGYIGMKDFRGLIIEAMQKSGFYSIGEVAIKKNQQMQSIVKHAPGLAMHIMKSDRNKCIPCYNDYALIFEKPGENLVPITGGMTGDEWVKIASGCWMISEEKCDIRESDVLNTKVAKTEEDVKHICPLQLEFIRRFVHLYSNPGEIVLDPFAGISSTGVICEEMEREFIGIELKEEYFQESVKNVKKAFSSFSQSLKLVKPKFNKKEI